MVFDNDFFNNSPLNQMGNNLAENSPFGNSSIFKSYTNTTPDDNSCGTPFTVETSESIIKNYLGLIALLKNPRGILFDYKNYTKETALEFIPPPVLSSDAPFGEIAEMKRSSTYVASPTIDYNPFDYSSLNKGICYLDPSPSYIINVEDRERKMEFAISFYYEGTSAYRMTGKQIGEYTEEGYIADKYKAIYLVTHSARVFYNFIKDIDLEEKIEKDIFKILIDRFKSAHSRLNKTNLSSLQWFYDNTPDFILHKFSKEELWNDLKLLLQHDAVSWFVDTSNYMIRIIQAIRTIDPSYLYTQFYADPKFIKDTYDHLGGESISSEQGGQMVPNKTIFASILLAVTYDYYQSQKKPLTSKINFTSNEINRVDGNILWGDNPNTYTLAQEEFREGPEQYSMKEGYSYRSKGWVGVFSHNLHPLELVYLTIEEKGQKPITVAFPAIMVYDIAYHDEWERAMYIVRIVGDIVGVILGVVALFTTANPFIIMLAVADIGLSGGDLIIQAFKDQIMNTEWGKKFIEAWEQIYTIGGIAIAVASAPQLIKGLLGAGAKILRTASEQTRNFIKITLAKAILEINISRGLKVAENGIEIGSNVLKGTREVRFFPAAVDRLEEAGVIFARITDEQGKLRYTAFYKGEELVETGTAKKLKEELKSVWHKEGRRLEEGLDAILLEKGHGLDKSFFDYARIVIQEEPPIGILHGQSTDYTCVATSLRMCLDDLDVVFDESTLAKSIGTVEVGADRGVSILEIPKFKDSPSIYYNADVDGINLEVIPKIDFEGFKTKMLMDENIRAIVSVGSEDIGYHALIVDKIEADKVFLRDPLPSPNGSSYSVSLAGFKKLFRQRAVLFKK